MSIHRAFSVAHSAVRVKVNPEVGRQAIKRGVDRSYRLWTILKHRDVAGRGWLPLAEAEAAAGEFGVRRFAHILELGKGSFWEVVAGRVRLRGLEKVALDLGVLPVHPVLIPAEAVSHLERFRAHIYAAWLESHNRDGQGILISRQRLMALFGRTKTTLRRWERLAGVVRQANLGYRPASENPWGPELAWERRWLECVVCHYRTSSALKFQEHCLRMHGTAEWRGLADLTWELPSTYWAGPEVRPAPRGMSGKIRHALRALLITPEGQPQQRLYFRHANAAVRATQSGRDVYLRHSRSPGLWERRPSWEWLRGAA